MKEKINRYLDDIEKEKDIKILLACETGSRAWGFPSPDSDYDIRIIYMHRKDWYLSLSEKKDTINLMLENNDLDITGWDLRKSLRLLQKSNPPLLERIQSPIVYRKDDAFVDELTSLAQQHYSRIATIHHYLSMAKKFYDELKANQTYKLKKFFYALRSATACKWIMEKDEIPPIEFSKMLDGLDIPADLVKRINELIELKSGISETYLHQGEKELFDFIETQIRQAEEQKAGLAPGKGNLEQLNRFFIKTLNRHDH